MPHKRTVGLVSLLCFGVLFLPSNVLAEKMAIIEGSEDNVTITIHTNKDVDQIVMNGGEGEYLLTPQTEYSDEQLKGNNQVMDMNGDHQVDQKDYDILKAHIDGGCKDYTDRERCTHCGAADINGDGVIDEKDLKLLQSHLDGDCKLDDCYFHGTRINRTDTNDGFTWSFIYTPTIRGIDNITFKPQSVTSTGTRTGDEKVLTVKAEEFKNPEILKGGVDPNQNKYLINNAIKLYVITPLETDQVSFKTNSGSFIVNKPDTIDYANAQKIWSKTYTPTQAGNENFVITGQGEQSNNTYLDGKAYSFTERIVDPQILNNSQSTQTHSYSWTTSSTDADGNVTTEEHTYVWYTITMTATANADTEYVVFHTTGGDVTDNSYLLSGGNHVFSTSWDSTNSGESATANAYCYIGEKPVTKNTYSVTFDPQGGSQVDSKTAEYDSTISEPSDPQRYGYTFQGWYREPRCINAWDFDKDKIKGTTILYAKWSINNYKVSFDTQGGSSVASKTAEYNTTIIEPGKPVRSNYTFGGWFRDSGCTDAFVFGSDRIQSDRTLYAKWVPIVYKVTFDTKGGNELPAIGVNYDCVIPTVTEPTLTGYSFSGWYREETCTNAWNLSTDTINGPTTLYAKWTINQYTISFNAMGGSSVNDIKADFNTLVIPPSPPNREGFTFLGWYKDIGCTDVWRFDAYKINEDTTLYAKWKAN